MYEAFFLCYISCWWWENVVKNVDVPHKKILWLPLPLICSNHCNGVFEGVDRAWVDEQALGFYIHLKYCMYICNNKLIKDSSSNRFFSSPFDVPRSLKYVFPFSYNVYNVYSCISIMSKVILCLHNASYHKIVIRWLYLFIYILSILWFRLNKYNILNSYYFLIYTDSIALYISIKYT